MEKRKTSQLYAELAVDYVTHCVNRETHEVSDEQMIGMAQCRDFDKVEKWVQKFTGNANFCKDVANVINAVFKDYMVNTGEVRAQYCQYVLSDGPRPRDLNPVVVTDSHNYGKMVCQVLAAVHDEWVQSNADQFTDEAMANRRYLFMPFEVIGWEAVKPYYVILVGILADLWPDQQWVEAHEVVAEDGYLHRSGEFFRQLYFGQYGVLRDYLRDYVGNGTYSSIPQKIQDELRNDGQTMVAMKIEKQLKEAWKKR